MRAQREGTQRSVFHIHGNTGAGCEPALLVELLVVRLRDLRHRAENAAFAADERAVQQASVRHPPRRPHHQHPLVGCRGERRQRFVRRAAQVVAEEEVLACIAADGEFRHQHDRRIRSARRHRHPQSPPRWPPDPPRRRAAPPPPPSGIRTRRSPWRQSYAGASTPALRRRRFGAKCATLSARAVHYPQQQAKSPFRSATGVPSRYAPARASCLATVVHKAIRHRRDVSVRTVSARCVMFVARAMPERVFLRLWQARGHHLPLS